jgi:hypothetical protein
VILSHKFKFIFLKTFKTASTSVEIALSEFVGKRGVITAIDQRDEAVRAELGFRGPQNEQIPLLCYTRRNWTERLRDNKRALYYNHMPAHEIRATVGRRVWRNYYRFCVERNPWDKVVSFYYWKTQHAHPRPSLLEFLHSPDRGGLSNWNVYTIDDQLVVDRVCRYENLEAELEAVRQELGLPAELQIPVTKNNTGRNRRSYQAIVGQQEREIVARACAREISLFGYTFD